VVRRRAVHRDGGSCEVSGGREDLLV